MRKYFSPDPQVWYIAGTWAWWSAALVFITLYLFDIVPSGTPLAAGVGLLIWLIWPALAFQALGE